jgi:hypothetical protein
MLAEIGLLPPEGSAELSLMEFPLKMNITFPLTKVDKRL